VIVRILSLLNSIKIVVSKFKSKKVISQIKCFTYSGMFLTSSITLSKAI